VSGYIQRQRETIAKLVEQAEQLRSDLAAVTAERDAIKLSRDQHAPIEVLERLADATNAVVSVAGRASGTSACPLPAHLQEWYSALDAYRAATAPLRTETAVVLDIGHHVRACVRLGELRMTADEKQRLEDLANEHTAPAPEKPPLRVHDLRATFSGSGSDEPEACSCEEAEALKRKLLDIRTEYELWETSAKGGSATLSAIALILRGEP
jgi:hypothetical protein